MNEINCNLNDTVKIKLTKEGKHIYREYHERLIAAFPKSLKIEVCLPKSDKDGYTKMQLREVMCIFGSEMYVGNSSLPIRMNFKILNT